MAFNEVVLTQAQTLVSESKFDELGTCFIDWVRTESLETIKTLLERFEVKIWPAANYMAAEQGRLEIFNLLQNQKNVVGYSLDEILNISIMKRDAKFINRAIELGASPVVGVVKGIIQGNLKMVQEYLDRGADLDDPRIHRAIYNSLDSDIFSYLLSKRLNVNIKCFQVMSLLMKNISISMLEYAVLRGEASKIDKLIRLARPPPPELEYWRMLFRTPEKMLTLLTRLDWQEVGQTITIAMNANAYYRELNIIHEAGYYQIN